MRILIMLMLISAVRPCGASADNWTDDDTARLKRGEILMQIIDGEKPGTAARVTAMFHATASAVWDIIGYCEYELVYMRGLKFCEMLEGDRFQMTMRHQVRNSWYSPTMDYIFAARREPGGNGQAHLVEGDLNVLEGQWKFFPMADDYHVIVVHEVRIQPKIPAPRWLVRRSLRRDLPDMLACIRGLASASGRTGDIENDLERCPGNISDVLK